MTPVEPPVTTNVFVAPVGMSSSQVSKISAYVNRIKGGNLDGTGFVVTAWIPSADELRALNAGGSVFLSCLGSLPPHMLTANFNEATYGIED